MADSEELFSETASSSGDPANSADAVGDSSAGEAGDKAGTKEKLIGEQGKQGGAKGAGDGSAADAGDSDKGDVTGVEDKKANEGKESLDERVRRYQSERDRARDFATRTIAQAQQYLDIDQYGQIKGLKKSNQDVGQETATQMQELLDNAVAGDKNALHQLLWVVKEQAKGEATQESQKILNTIEHRRQVEASLMKDFPGLYQDVNGQKGVNPESPLFREGLKILSETKDALGNNRFDVSNPTDLRVLIELAEGRLLKSEYPKMEKRVKEEALRNLAKNGGLSALSDSGGAHKGEDAETELSEDQLDYFKRQRGFSPDEVKEISKIMKAAKKRGGYYLS